MATGAVLGAAAAGAAIGGAAAWMGGAAIMTGVALGWSAGMYAGKSIWGPDAPDVEGPRLDSLGVQTSSYGDPIPIVYGSMRIAGNVIWSTGLKEHKSEEDIGGKGMGGGGTSTTYSYTCSFAIGICEGEITGINRIWMDGKLFQDENKSSGVVNIIRTSDKVKNISVYTGTESQEPDPLMEAEEGIDNVPAYRGLAYIVFEDLELEDYGNRIPNIEFEIAIGLKEELAILDLSSILQHSRQTFILRDDIMIVGDWDRGDYSWGDATSATGELSYIDLSIIKEVARVKDTAASTIFPQLSGNLIVNDTGYDPTWYTINGIDKTRAGGYLPNEGKGYLVDLDDQNQYYRYPITGKADPGGWQEVMVLWADEKGLGTILYVHGMIFNEGNGHCPAEDYQIPYVNDDILHPYDIFGIAFYDGEAYFLYNESVLVYSSPADLPTGSVKRQIYLQDPDDLDKRISNFSDNEDIFIDSNANLFLLFGSRLIVYDLETGDIKTLYTFGTELVKNPLDNVVGDLISRAGFDSTEYDTSELSDRDLIGFSVTKSMSVKEAINPLMQAYQFDVIEAEGQIKCTTREKEQVRSFTEDELAAHEQGSDVSTAITATRSQKTDLPTKVTVEYKDQNSAYQTAAQYAKRVTQDFDNHKTIKLPLVTTASHALQVAEKLLATAWASRSNYSIQVLSENIDLLPGCSIEAAGYRMHIEEISTKLPSIIEIQGKSEEPSSYVSNAAAVSPEVPEQSLSSKTPITFSIMMNLPGIERVYTTPGFFVAPYSFGDLSNWTGAVIYDTNDGGDTWQQINTINDQPLVARVESVPGSASPTRWDYENSITIQPINSKTDLLSSASKLSVLGGSNTAALGTSSGEWEVISYMDVTNNGDGTYTLSGLLRGRRGTENAISADKSLFVFLKSGSLMFVPVDSSDLGNNKDYKVVSIGNSTTSKSALSWSSEGDTLKPWSPVHIEGKLDDQGGLRIEWMRRSRTDDSWNKGDVPMLENEEKYEVDIISTDTNEVVRTLSISGENSDRSGITYMRGNQIRDLANDFARVRIYQISDIVGRGFPSLPVEFDLGSVALPYPDLSGGTKLYMIGVYEGGYSIMEMDLTRSWNVESADPVYHRLGTTTTYVAGNLYVSPSGHRLYYTCRAGILEFSLSTNWDFSSATQTSTNTSNGADAAKSPQYNEFTQGVFFKPDGTKMYELGYPSQVYQGIFEFDLDAWNLSTYSDTGKSSLNLIIEKDGETSEVVYDIFIDDSGTKLYAGYRYWIVEYEFGTAWDISTLSYVRKLPNDCPNIPDDALGMWGCSGIQFAPDGKSLYAMGNTGSLYTGQQGYFFTLDIAWDLSTASKPYYFTIDNLPDAYYSGIQIGGN